MARPKRTGSPHRRPCESGDSAALPLLLTLTFTNPNVFAVARTPGGRPPWMAAVFGSRQDASSENAGVTQSAADGFDFTRKVLSLVTFFAPAKKVTRLQAKAFDFSKDQDHFALSREFISFAGAKETNQRKGPSPTRQNNHLRDVRNFPTRHSMARSENGGHPRPPPSGSANRSGCLSDGKAKGKGIGESEGMVKSRARLAA